jgi:hypothetical protein
MAAAAVGDRRQRQLGLWVQPAFVNGFAPIPMGGMVPPMGPPGMTTDEPTVEGTTYG